MAEKNRKNYLMSEDSIIQYYKNPERYLYQSLEIESQFERPYDYDSYRARHLALPRQEWPSYEPGAVGSINGGLRPRIDEPSGECNRCDIYLPFPPYEDDCSDGMDWLTSSLCTWYPMSRQHPDVTVEIVDYLGEWLTIEDDWFFGDLGGHLTFGLDSGDHQINISIIDSAGNFCDRTSIVFNCSSGQCPPETSISWNDSVSSETIARSSSCTIAILDGVGPYHWEETGTDFSLTNAYTDGLVNELNAGATACGSCTITVTDACGETITGWVRCTTGQWVPKTAYNDQCVSSGPGYWINNLAATYARYYFDYGNKRQEQLSNWGWLQTAPSGETACSYESSGYWGGFDTVQEYCTDLTNTSGQCILDGDNCADGVNASHFDNYNTWCAYGSARYARCICAGSLFLHEWQC